jgi:hypothetical protein
VNTNEERIDCTNIGELRNLRNFFYKVKGKWDNQRKKKGPRVEQVNEGIMKCEIINSILSINNTDNMA